MPIKLDYEVTEEISEKALEAIEIARNSGKIKKGTNETTKSLEKGIAKLVAFSQDTQPEEVIMHLPVLCKEKGIQCIPIKNKNELGTAAGLPIGCSSVAIIEEGDAKNLIEEINKSLNVEAKK